MNLLDRNQDFVRFGVVPKLQDGIKKAHQRSAAFGLSEGAEPASIPLGQSDLSRSIEQNRLLHTHALPVMENLYQQIVDNHNMVILADAGKPRLAWQLLKFD